LLLQIGELGGDLDDVISCPLVHFGVAVPDVVQDVQHHGSVSGTHLIDIQVVVGIRTVLVVLDKVPGDRFAIVRREKLGRSMPELAKVVGLLVVERVLESGVAVAEGTGRRRVRRGARGSRRARRARR
jgi:hypothetical protein